ncbi:MAG: hypothetical protein IJB19_08230 [Clostridia bacterium]|nr:hypothetical protein [Clostridia bacterium]
MKAQSSLIRQTRRIAFAPFPRGKAQEAGDAGLSQRSIFFLSKLPEKFLFSII